MIFFKNKTTTAVLHCVTPTRYRVIANKLLIKHKSNFKQLYSHTVFEILELHYKWLLTYSILPVLSVICIRRLRRRHYSSGHIALRCWQSVALIVCAKEQ